RPLGAPRGALGDERGADAADGAGGGLGGSRSLRARLERDRARSTLARAFAGGRAVSAGQRLRALEGAGGAGARRSGAAVGGAAAERNLRPPRPQRVGGGDRDDGAGEGARARASATAGWTPDDARARGRRRGGGGAPARRAEG